VSLEQLIGYQLRVAGLDWDPKGRKTRSMGRLTFSYRQQRKEQSFNRRTSTANARSLQPGDQERELVASMQHPAPQNRSAIQVGLEEMADEMETAGSQNGAAKLRFL
jgi:hypothetical protein